MEFHTVTSYCRKGYFILGAVVPRNIVNLKSGEIYVDKHNLLFACDYILFRHYTENTINVRAMKELKVHLNTTTREYIFKVPLVPAVSYYEEKLQNEEGAAAKIALPPISYLKMHRVTDICMLMINGSSANFDRVFSYGFGCSYCEDTINLRDTLRNISRVSDPSRMSPIQRLFSREIDEKDDFSIDQYKANYAELPLPEGHENPMKFRYKWSDVALTDREQSAYKTLMDQPLRLEPDHERFAEHGLIELVLAICYDIRTTLNDPTCESGWTRAILMPMTQYFESAFNLYMVVENFLRRSITYPLYRNYELSRQCVEDAIDALSRGPAWILKQLLVTYDLFQTSDDDRTIFNRYFIEDYIRFINTLEDNFFKVLSKNLKNAFLSVTKKDLRLNLPEIESVLLRELLTDMHLGETDDSDDESIEVIPEDEEEGEVEEEDEEEEGCQAACPRVVTKKTIRKDVKKNPDQEGKEEQKDPIPMAENGGIRLTDPLLHPEHLRFPDPPQNAESPRIAESPRSVDPLRNRGQVSFSDPLRLSNQSESGAKQETATSVEESEAKEEACALPASRSERARMVKTPSAEIERKKQSPLSSGKRVVKDNRNIAKPTPKRESKKQASKSAAGSDDVKKANESAKKGDGNSKN